MTGKNSGNHTNRTEKYFLNGNSLRDLRNNIKHTNIYSIEVSEGKDRKKGKENLFDEIMAQHFLALEKERDI